MNRLRTLLLSGTVLVVFGCGEHPDRWKAARPATVLTNGEITFQGEPLAGATVVFQPIASAGIGAAAITDAEGKFELKTFPPDPGAIPGKYHVSITKTEVPRPTNAEKPLDPDPVDTISLIPEKYGIPIESGLTAEIPDAGTRTLVINLQ